MKQPEPGDRILIHRILGPASCLEDSCFSIDEDIFKDLIRVIKVSTLKGHGFPTTTITGLSEYNNKLHNFHQVSEWELIQRPKEENKSASYYDLTWIEDHQVGGVSIKLVLRSPDGYNKGVILKVSDDYLFDVAEGNQIPQKYLLKRD